MRFPNLIWAARKNGSQFQLAASLGESESWLSRRVNGHIEFTEEDRERIAKALNYPVDWLFATPNPPARNLTSQPEHQEVAA